MVDSGNLTRGINEPILDEGEDIIDFTREGIRGLDLKNRGEFITPYADINRIVVTNTNVTIHPELSEHEFYKPRTLDFPEDEDPKILLKWYEIAHRLITWAMQEGPKGRLKDGTMVFKLDIPDFDLTAVKLKDRFKKYLNLKEDASTKKQGSGRIYARHKELEKEKQEIGIQMAKVRGE